ncbi:MAG: RNA polymerase sigma-54 factor, partial [Candidatus Marinimicrobia bacterium]|nr:RNA polymerase sigma-54 factor [Candidatus Neomarinimicrobiota bacterium]
MQLAHSQVQKLSQELRLTPQQILQSTILQLTTLALEAKVTQELEQNPVLEEIEPEEQPVEGEKESDQDDENEIDWEEILHQNDDYEAKIEYDRSKEEYRPVQVSPRGLVDHLFDQLKLMNLKPVEENIANELIWNIDERGYLTVPIENIAFGSSVSLAIVERVLKQIQQMDPPGIGARDLRECLLIQLRQLENVDDAII